MRKEGDMDNVIVSRGSGYSPFSWPRQSVGSVAIVRAETYMRPMRGGSCSHLIVADDGHAYIVKFQDNPQGKRVLANEWLATQLLRHLDLPVPEARVISVSKQFANANPQLGYFEQGRFRRYLPGLQYGSRLVGGLLPLRFREGLENLHSSAVTNVEHFAGVLSFDKWTCNHDNRQFVLTPQRQSGRYAATFIDSGFCFGLEWKWKDASLVGLCGDRQLYSHINGWHSYEPWLTKIADFNPDVLWQAAMSTPGEWYARDLTSLKDLVAALIARRSSVRTLLQQMREEKPTLFPRWADA